LLQKLFIGLAFLVIGGIVGNSIWKSYQIKTYIKIGDSYNSGFNLTNLTLYSKQGDNNIMINAEKKEVALLKLLNEWEEKEEVYSLESIHWFSLLNSFEPSSYFLEGEKTFWKNKNFLLDFGFYESGDGTFALWYYDGLVGAAPVVYYGTDGEVSMVTPSFEDFVCMLLKGKIIYAGSSDNGEMSTYAWGDFDDIDEQLKELPYERDVKTDEVLVALNKSFSKFQSFIEKHVTCRDEEIILSDTDRHPNFLKFVESVINE